MTVPPSQPIDIAVTGLGVVSAAGVGAEAAWKSVVSGQPSARVLPELRGLPADFACVVDELDVGVRLGANLVRRTDRFTQLALIAGAEALDAARLDPTDWDGARVGVVVGTAFGGVTTLAGQAVRAHEGSPVSPVTVPAVLANMAAGVLSLEWNARGPSFAVSTACASGATAIGLAASLLRDDSCDIVIAGGAEAPVNRLLSAAFARMDALSVNRARPAAASRPFDAERDGFVLAEGAAMLVLERAADASARRVPALAHLAGFGASADAHHLTSPDPEGRGLERAVIQALRAAGAAPADVDHVNAHATSTPKGDLAEAALLKRLFGHGVSVTAPKGALGHTLGAAGAIEAALTVLSIAEQTAPPTTNLEEPDPRIGLDLDLVTGAARTQRIGLALSNSCGFGGQNTVLAFTPAQPPKAAR
ncbi:MAG TPA: beta-ketoacyl-[acyl-carrier-protein] synthase family protein [Actinospica sp.]|jgi:3-oxoacyl-[acyl-carrier-protein] synthase II|nr:beta-ketoacyl-[acyl-carrier-protein] synthase family protein [Actinospica sp.]